jgi:hypothetical protein
MNSTGCLYRRYKSSLTTEGAGKGSFSWFKILKESYLELIPGILKQDKDNDFQKKLLTSVNARLGVHFFH